jgi:hypothetical protein
MASSPKKEPTAKPPEPQAAEDVLKDSTETELLVSFLRSKLGR